MAIAGLTLTAAPAPGSTGVAGAGSTPDRAVTGPVGHGWPEDQDGADPDGRPEWGGPDGRDPDGDDPDGIGGATPEAWAWTQLTGAGAQVRYVVTPAVMTCPTVTFGGVTPPTRPMLPSSGPSGTAFPTTVCTRDVPAGTTGTTATINAPAGTTVRPTSTGTVPLPRWTGRPSNIAVIGDTGCRVPRTGVYQNCRNPQDWQFAAIAGSAAGANPDLVIHTGDYIYRSSPQRRPTADCPTDERSWGCLVSDFLEPAGSLLARAPIVMVRGNHELCDRNGEVWFRYQATDLSTNRCQAADSGNYNNPVPIQAGSLHLLLFDSAFADDSTAGPNAQQVTQYTPQFAMVNSQARANPAGDNFLLTHKPMWTVTRAFPGFTNPIWVNHTLAAASANAAGASASALDPNIDLVLSGHVHLFQLLNFAPTPPPGAPHRPPQVTVGSSGTVLDDQVTDSDAVGKPIDTIDIDQIRTRRVWGYARLTGNPWNLGYFDSAGNPVAGTNCTLNAQGTAFTGCS